MWSLSVQHSLTLYVRHDHRYGLCHNDRPTFSNEEERRLFTPVAAKAAVRIAAFWTVRDPEGAALLDVSDSVWDRMKAGRSVGVLTQEQLLRASALIGIYKGLHDLVAGSAADLWPRLVNRGPFLGHKSPIVAILEAGFPRMLETRKYIDAVRGGA